MRHWLPPPHPSGHKAPAVLFPEVSGHRVQCSPRPHREPPREAISTLRNSVVASTAPQARLEQAREEIASRHNIGDRVRIWIDDASIGCGERHLMVTAIGRTHVKLYSYANLAEVTVSRRDFEAHAQAYGSHARTVLGILERNLKAYERAKLDHDRPLERAWDALRKQAEGVLP